MLFRCGYASLYEALSVSQSIGRSIGWSAHPSIRLSEPVFFLYAKQLKNDQKWSGNYLQSINHVRISQLHPSKYPCPSKCPNVAASMSPHRTCYHVYTAELDPGEVSWSVNCHYKSCFYLPGIFYIKSVFRPTMHLSRTRCISRRRKQQCGRWRQQLQQWWPKFAFFFS